jgi:hypothetical protein
MCTACAPEDYREVMMKIKRWPSRLSRGRGGDWPVGTLAFYGPDDRHASKAVASIIAYDGDEPLMKKWFEDGVDVRVDNRIGKEVGDFFRRHGPARIVVADGIFGCPHEEGIDYPLDGVCPQCPFWATHDRFENVEAKIYQ